MRKLFIAILATISLAACASDDSAFSSQDIMFAEMMIPHHEQALLMADIAFANTSNPEVLDLASRIRSAQGPEIELMKSWPGVDADSHMGHAMDGMLSDGEIADLKAATDEAFDRLFLEGMIKHHQGAIEMAEMVFDSANAEVSELAKSIIDSQQVEIAEMQALLR